MSFLQTDKTDHKGQVLPGQGGKGMRAWTAEETALLDKYDNETVAKITGRSKNAVANKRALRKENFQLYKCSECGKMFVALEISQWAYRRVKNGHVRYMCSYHCMRAFDGKQGQKKVAQ